MAPPATSDAATSRATIRWEERCITGNGYNAADPSDIGCGPAHAGENPGEGTGIILGRIRHHRQPQRRKPRRIAIGIDDHAADLRRQIDDDMGEHRAAAEIAQGLVAPAHFSGSARRPGQRRRSFRSAARSYPTLPGAAPPGHSASPGRGCGARVQRPARVSGRLASPSRPRRAAVRPKRKS